jgi:hypothetical protein
MEPVFPSQKIGGESESCFEQKNQIKKLNSCSNQ